MFPRNFDLEEGERRVVRVRMEDQENEKKWWWECITSLELRVIALHKLVSLVSAATSQPAPVMVVPQVLQKIRVSGHSVMRKLGVSNTARA